MAQFFGGSSSEICFEDPDEDATYVDCNSNWNPAGFDELCNDMIGMFPNISVQRIKQIVDLYGLNEVDRIVDELLRISGDGSEEEHPHPSSVLPPVRFD